MSSGAWGGSPTLNLAVAGLIRAQYPRTRGTAAPPPLVLSTKYSVLYFPPLITHSRCAYRHEPTEARRLRYSRHDRGGPRRRAGGVHGCAGRRGNLDHAGAGEVGAWRLEAAGRAGPD